MDEGSSTAGPSASLHLKVNGQSLVIPRWPRRSLLEVLRLELSLTGVKFGCGEGQCGACTVLLGSEAVRSCQVDVADLGGRTVVTVEGLAPKGALNPVQRAFVELGAFQCGFCTPGMVVAATALLNRNPHPSEAEIREAMEGNLCRCCGYARILRAIHWAAELSTIARPERP
jgi:aerobic-type carbon monoxide dehydrogenase small subunit (CoxS/CutS family)